MRPYLDRVKPCFAILNPKNGVMMKVSVHEKGGKNNSSRLGDTTLDCLAQLMDSTACHSNPIQYLPLSILRGNNGKPNQCASAASC